MDDLKLNVDINKEDQTVTIDFLDGPILPALNRSQIYALIAALKDALPLL